MNCERCNLVEIGRANYSPGTLGDMAHNREPSHRGATEYLLECTEYLLECSVCGREGVFLRVHSQRNEP